MIFLKEFSDYIIENENKYLTYLIPGEALDIISEWYGLKELKL